MSFRSDPLTQKKGLNLTFLCTKKNKLAYILKILGTGCSGMSYLFFPEMIAKALFVSQNDSKNYIPAAKRKLKKKVKCRKTVMTTYHHPPT